MKQYRHDFRVFEITPTSRVQYEVTLIAEPDPDGVDRRRVDRVTTGAFIGRIWMLVDWVHIDQFKVGNKFTMVLGEKGWVPA